MVARLGLLPPLLGLVLAGAAPSGFMLCVHRDGQAFVEDQRELCCAAPCPDASEACGDEPSACPDDECRDLPLALAGEDLLPNPPPLVLPAAPALPVDGPSVPESPAPSDVRPDSGVLGPPRSPALALLRTVVLRP